MFLERDNIVINVNHICSIKKEEYKIHFLLSCGKIITYDFKTDSEASKAFDRIKNYITKEYVEEEKTSSLSQAATDWLWSDDD